MKINKNMVFMIVVLTVAIGVAISIVKIERDGKSKKMKVSGNIETDYVKLSFRVQGKISELLTDEGQLIKKSDVVARLDTDELIQIKNQAEGSLKAAQYQYDLDKIDYTRAENLFQAGAIPAQQRDSAKTKFDADQANVQALQASLDLATTRLGFADLVTPIDGYVLVKSALAGEYVQPGSTVFTVADLNNIWVTGYINEKDLGKVKLNQEAQVKTDSFPDRVYKGRVSFISSEAEFTPKQIQTTEERVKLVYRIKIKVDNTNLELKPGMPADGYIIE